MASFSNSVVASGLIALLSVGGVAQAKLYLSKSEALALAFPDADRTDLKSVVLTDEQVAYVEKKARAKLRSPIVSFHRGWRGDELLGYARIDIHRVRTLNEALLVVLSPEGEVRLLRTLAFHEPEEYKASERWLRLLEGKKPGAKLRLGDEIHGIAGSTLTSQAVTKSVRTVLALYEVVFGQEE